jgi:tRNA(Arg) A34 adenosine deaminase TadA
MNRRLADRALDDLLGLMHERLIASLEQGWGGPFAAVVVRDGSPLGVGTNTVLRDRDASRHAEVNALAAAGAAAGGVPMSGAELVTSHFPCLMCYHALKWAGVRRFYYVFDYEETRRLFGFDGDSRLLEDLGLAAAAFDRDPSLEIVRVGGAASERLFRGDLVERWNRDFRARLSAYDIGGGDK